METLKLLGKLGTKSVFGVQNVQMLAKCDRKYARLILYRLKKRKLIKEVTRNVYTTKDNIFVIGSNLTTPSYISFLSASHFFGYTEQIVNMIQVATTTRKAPIDFEGYRIKFIPMKYFFGFEKIPTSDGSVFMVENEKLLIDAFLKPSEMGNFYEIVKVFKNAKVSKEKMTDYLKRVNNQSAVRRVGFLLEKIKNMDISGSFALDKNYIKLNPFSKTWKKISSKWRVKV